MPKKADWFAEHGDKELRRLRRPEVAAEIETRIRHFTLARKALSARGSLGPDWTPADVEVIGSFEGDPHRMTAWLIYATREQASAARERQGSLIDLVRNVLLETGYPSEAVPTVQTAITSLPEIDEGGGRFAFFR